MKLGAVILAAGAGSRLGGRAKALLRHGDETYLARIARIARLAGATDMVVVVGRPHAAAVGAIAREIGLDVVVNALPERGMASSVAIGFGAIREYRVDAAWLWPVDHPGVQLATLELLVGALGSHEVAQPRFGERGGHPPLIARALWPKLAACGPLEDGARGVLRAADVTRIAVDDLGVVRDVDTPADLVETA
jgi:CTP:molybdopterin cytidylyltransferase MocA